MMMMIIIIIYVWVCVCVDPKTLKDYEKFLGYGNASEFLDSSGS